MVIPTRDRLPILRETLRRLDRQAGAVRFEVIVVDDGSADGTVEAVRRHARETSSDVVLVENPGRGPAAARNRALAIANAPVCLIINDDTWPRPDLLARHRDFHASRPEANVAMLGRIDLAPEPPPTPFMRWLADMHFDFAGLAAGDEAGGRRFFTANVSTKTEFLRSAGGFDESFEAAAHEDIDLGLRLEERGMRLVYDPEAVVEHCHPMDLPMAIERSRQVGRTLAAFVERHPDWPVARRPGLRHRVKAAALTGLAALRARTPRLQRETWRFLCHEAAREGYWDAVDRHDGVRGGELLIGRTLVRLARSDADAQMPASPARG